VRARRHLRLLSLGAVRVPVAGRARAHLGYLPSYIAKDVRPRFPVGLRSDDAGVSAGLQETVRGTRVQPCRWLFCRQRSACSRGVEPLSTLVTAGTASGRHKGACNVTASTLVHCTQTWLVGPASYSANTRGADPLTHLSPPVHCSLFGTRCLTPVARRHTVLCHIV